MPEGKSNHSVITWAGVRTDKQDTVESRPVEADPSPYKL